MNKCLGKACKGFGVFPGTQTQYDNFGAFRYISIKEYTKIKDNVWLYKKLKFYINYLIIATVQTQKDQEFPKILQLLLAANTER